MEFLSDIQERLELGLGGLGGRVPQVLSEPREYPQEAMVLALMAAAAVLLLALLVMLGLETTQEAAARRRMGVRRDPKAFARKALIVVAVLGVLGIVAGLAPLVPAAGNACGGCHAVEEAVESWSEGSHASVSCYACHAQPGVLGALQASAHEVGVVLGGLGSQSANPRSCLRCHKDVASGSLISGTLTVRHQEMIAAQMDCLVCHASVGHKPLDGPPAHLQAVRPAFSAPTSQRSRMSRCLSCHDGTKASSACETCHRDNSVDQTSGDWSMVGAGTTATCDGCHKGATERECVRCHGLELPHPAAFMSQHAGRADEDPELCARCHEGVLQADACSCHDAGEVHGTYSLWFPEHGAAARTNWPGGCNCHDAAFCNYCHTASPLTGERL